MSELVERAQALRSRFQTMSPRARLVSMLALSGFVAIGVIYYASTFENADAVLFSGLADEDAAEVVARLSEMHVPHEIAEGGSVVLVPEARVHETRLLLAAEGLPSGGGVGFEIFDEQRFGESEFAEQVKYHRALEGELARTISHISGVESARVHLVLPQRSLFASEQQPATASVALRLRPGFRMEEARVRGVVNLVASSVRALSPEDVTVVDGQGRRLTDDVPSDEQATGDALEFRRRIEREKEAAVQQMLDTTLGAGRSVVRVAAAVSFTREERTEERFDPDAVATRSVQIEEERDSRSSRTAEGVPGAVSNLPGGEAATVATSADGLVRRSETRNFEVTKVVRRAVEPVGRVQRLDVAVVVDGQWSGTGEAATFTPRDADELARLEGIVSRAVGLDAERGDQVTVECVPFARETEPDIADPGPVTALTPYEPYFPHAAAAVGALVLLLILVVALRRRRRRATEVEGRVSVRELEAGVAAKLSTGEPTRSEDADRIRQLSADLAEGEPEVAAQVVRGWLAEGAA